MSTPSLNQSSLKPAPLLAKHATSTPSGSNMYKTTGNVSAHVNEVYRTPQSTPGPKVIESNRIVHVVYIYHTLYM